MRSSRWYRTLTTLWGLWFAFALTESLAVPMVGMADGAMTGAAHQRGMQQASAACDTASPAAEHPAQDQGMAGMAGMGLQSPCSPNPTPHDSNTHCLGLSCCCSCSPIALPVHPTTDLLEIAVRDADAPGWVSRAAVAPLRRPHVQPFANGPPTQA